MTARCEGEKRRAGGVSPLRASAQGADAPPLAGVFPPSGILYAVRVPKTEPTLPRRPCPGRAVCTASRPCRGAPGGRVRFTLTGSGEFAMSQHLLGSVG